MEYNVRRNSLEVLCNHPSKLSEFSLEGRLLKETLLSFFSTAFVNTFNNSKIFYDNQNKNFISGDYDLIFTDSACKVAKRDFIIPKNIKNTIAFSGGLYHLNNDKEIFFNPAFSEKYFKIINDTLISMYKIDFGIIKDVSQMSENYILNNLAKLKFQLNTLVITNEFIGFNCHLPEI